MKRSIKTLVAAAMAFCFVGCGTVKQMQGAYNFVNCEYEYNSLSNLSIAGIDVTDGVSPLQVPRIVAVLSGKAESVPLEMTVNLDIANPNSTAAIMNGLQYVLNIDGIDFTSGKIDRPLNIPAGSKQTVPLRVGVDLKTLLTGDTADATVKAVKNIVGVGDEASVVTVKLKPTFKVGDRMVESSSDIPVRFKLGGK